MLRDLDLRLQHGPEVGDRIVIPTPDAVRDDNGEVRIGVIATGVDVVAATVAMRSLAPDWLATSDLSVARCARNITGAIVGRANVLRSGRTTAVIEVDLHDEENGRAVAHAVAGFVRISRPPDSPLEERDDPDEHEVYFANESSGLRHSFLETLGIEDAGGGELSLARSPYTENSVGSLQGGMVATLCEVAGATATDGCPIDLTVRYLASGRNGPYQTRASLLREEAGARMARVELTDGGSGRAMAVANVTTR